RYAGNSPVSTGQWKTRGVVVGGIVPTGRGGLVTGTAIKRECRLHMVRLFGRRVIRRVAIIAVNRRTRVLLLIVSSMTRFAIGHGVSAGERKSVGGVQFEGTASVLPVTRRMTSLALLAKLAKMLVGMAVDTTDADMIENRIFVTADTLSGRMRSHQLET